MYRTIKKANYDLPDAADFVERLEKNAPEFFVKNSAIFVARAPGRLDVMGGIADYSGSLVLEMPIREAAFAALQKREDSVIKILSEGGGEKLSFEMPLEDFFDGDEPVEYAAARAYFKRDADAHWAAYVAGIFLVLMRERAARFETGANIYIASTIPQGKGASSSAALEAAAMTAAAAAFAIEMTPRETAILCQKVENLVVGAPCGIMDQMSVIGGKNDRLLSMICQPAELNPSVKIPDEIGFWGIDSGVRHSVGTGDYGAVRTGAFIGYRIIADLAGLKVRETATDGVVRIEDARWNGYLANITLEEYGRNFVERLPQKIPGAEFLKRYRGITDAVTKVLPEKIYAVLKPTSHPIGENHRVHLFAELLKRPITERVLIELGGLMHCSHESYSHCGLGSEGTDLLVELVKKIGDGNGLYGAKITGGGSGGTIAVLGLKNANRAIEKVAAEYAKQTGYQPHIFSGSSPGAADFGVIKLVRN